MVEPKWSVILLSNPTNNDNDWWHGQNNKTYLTGLPNHDKYLLYMAYQWRWKVNFWEYIYLKTEDTKVPPLISEKIKVKVNASLTLNLDLVFLSKSKNRENKSKCKKLKTEEGANRKYCKCDKIQKVNNYLMLPSFSFTNHATYLNFHIVTPRVR